MLSKTIVNISVAALAPFRHAAAECAFGRVATRFALYRAFGVHSVNLSPGVGTRALWLPAPQRGVSPFFVDGGRCGVIPL